MYYISPSLKSGGGEKDIGGILKSRIERQRKERAWGDHIGSYRKRHIQQRWWRTR
jgi:hypothetical protein